jgi:sialidase-1
MYDKRFMYEPGLRVPLLVRWPGVAKPGAATDLFALNVDFAPTFLGLAGVPVPTDMQGRSLTHLLQDQKPADWRDAIYYRYYHDPGHHNTRAHLGLRTATHKLIHFWKQDAWEMYDLVADPLEQRNIAADPAHRQKFEELKTQLARLKTEMKDDDRFASELPKDGVDANFPNHGQLGLRTVSEAVDSAVARKNSGKEAGAIFATNVFAANENGYHTYRIPSLVATPRGTLLAFAEGRKNNAGDAGNVDVVVRRSLDRGNTWSDAQTVWDDGANTCGNPCAVADRDTGLIWLLLTWNHAADNESKIISRQSKDTRRVFVASSADDGLTWSAPIEITADVKSPDWTWYATGPGDGIQVENGPHKGRLVIPCDHIEAGTKRYYSHVIYSDDRGRTWKLGGSTPQDQVNECAVVELAGGQLLLNMRNYDRTQKTRQQAISLDGGLSWTQQRHVPELVEPVCQASMRRLSWPASDRKGVILFANPASAKRERMTVRASFDDGRTWPVSHLLDPRPSAYSCMAVLPDSSIGILYETGVASPYENIVFSRFNRDWLGE